VGIRKFYQVKRSWGISGRIATVILISACSRQRNVAGKLHPVAGSDETVIGVPTSTGPGGLKFNNTASMKTWSHKQAREHIAKI